MRYYIVIMVSVTKVVANIFRPDIINAHHLWFSPYAANKSGVSGNFKLVACGLAPALNRRATDSE